MQASDPEGKNTSRVKRRRKFGCLLVALTAFAFGSIAALVIVWLWWTEPLYWRHYQELKSRFPVAQRRTAAERFESRMVTEVSADEHATRTITLMLDDVNTWLDQRLERWLANQGLALPPEVGDIMVAIDDGDIVLAFYAQTDHVEQVFSMFFHVSVLDEGKVQVKLKSIRGGRLRVPTDLILDLVNQAAPGEAVNVLLGKEVIEPIMQIDGSRQLRLHAIDVFDDRIEMRVRTEDRQ